MKRSPIWMARALALAMLAGAAAPASAQTQDQEQGAHQGMAMGGAASASSKAYMDAMQTMTEGMQALEMTGEPAVDFAMMMIPHHQSAIDMARAYLEYSDDPELTKLANEIVAAQQEEIEFLQNWLEEQR